MAMLNESQMVDIPDRHGVNVYDEDPGLQALLKIYLEQNLLMHLTPTFQDLGRAVGNELDELALVADKNPPILQLRNRQGLDDQKVIKHPAFIALERKAYSELSLSSMSHKKGVFGWSETIPPAAKYGLTYLFVQAEFGLCCPVSMADSLTHTLRLYGSDELINKYLPRLTDPNFDTQYQGAMFMTEQGAGSDVSRITTTATEKDGEWFLTGDKWFCSNPDADLAMVLAHVDGAPDGMKGLGLFLLPRHLDNGEVNHYDILRLKDKMGTRSMASGEIEFKGAKAYLLGEIGRGFQQMADMINLSRLSNGVRAAGLMRRAVGEAIYVCKNRIAFNKYLIDMPLQRKQLLKMMLPSEQARTMFFHIAKLLHLTNKGDLDAKKCVRVLTPLIKFRACRDARAVAADSMEVRGGCGYIEEWSDPRIVRDAHLGSIWEGTSNIVALDVMRAIKRNEALTYLSQYVSTILEDSKIPAESRTLLRKKWDDVTAFITKIIDKEDESDTRKAASALYNIVTAIFMAWESVQIDDNDWQRLAWSHMVLKYKLGSYDPLAPDLNEQYEASFKKLLNEETFTLAEANALL